MKADPLFRCRSFPRTLASVATVALAFAAATSGSGAASGVAFAAGTLEARVQRLEDAEAIRALLRDYGRHLDARDFAAWSTLFAVDGEWLGGLGAVRGRDALRQMLEGAMPSAPPTPQTASHHLFSNVHVEVDGDTATARSRWQFLIRGDERPVVAMMGRYEDQLVRENGHWKFQRRVVVTEIPYHNPLTE